MNIKNYYKLSIPLILLGGILLLTAFLTNSNAQTGEGDKLIKTEAIDIIKPYKPTLSEAYKLSTNPKLDISDNVKPNLKYNVNPKELEIPFATGRIKPARMKSEKIPNLHNFYAKAGFGRFTTPVAEVYYNNKWSRDYSVGAYAKHYSSQGQIANSSFSDNNVGVYGKKFYNRYTIGAGLDYSRNTLNFYGIDPENISTNIQISNQLFNSVSAKTRFATNFNPKSKLNYEINAGVYRFFNKYSSMEDNLTIAGNITNKIAPDTSLNVKIKADISTYQNDEGKQGNTLIYITPKYKMSFYDLRISAGFNFVNESTTSNKVHFYPVADLSYKISGNYLIAYGGMTGNLQKNSFKSFAHDNPFINDIITLKNTNTKLHFFGGIKGIINNFTDYNLTANIQNVNNIPFFITDLSSEFANQFDIIYDNGTIFNFSSQVNCHRSEKLKLNLRGDFFQYSLKTEEKAWHTPSLTLKFTGYYSIGNKINLSGSVYAINKTYSKINSPSLIKEYNGFIDANLGVEYKYSKAISAFIDMKNLANKNYYLWHNYQSSGFNIIGGVKYAF
ncbi:MAG: hypothetical protein COC01_08055 [Bacteroidetes bacterium]|nr:MAG: hypothetical protein COC01_08055 [Bacteroidota bacterium]